MNSQELQGLSIYSASYLGVSGSTPFDYSNIVGDKKQKTDIHSLVATQASVSRDAGKGIVYGASYGGGKGAASRTILSWHPEYDREDAADFAVQVLMAYRGKKNYDSGRWEGGTGSQAFNKMLDLLSVTEPQTPLLGTIMAPAAWPNNCGEYGAPSQLNWFVQALGSSMLQCVLVANWYYAEKAKIKASFSISCHDEVVYSTPMEDAEAFAYFQQIAHAQTWALLHRKLGIYDMPNSRCFMEVSIDEIWRKNPLKTVNTPTFSLNRLGEEYSFQRLVDEGYMTKCEQRWT